MTATTDLPYIVNAHYQSDYFNGHAPPRGKQIHGTTRLINLVEKRMYSGNIPKLLAS